MDHHGEPTLAAGGRRRDDGMQLPAACTQSYRPALRRTLDFCPGKDAKSRFGVPSACGYLAPRSGSFGRAKKWDAGIGCRWCHNFHEHAKNLVLGMSLHSWRCSNINLMLHTSYFMCTFHSHNRCCTCTLQLFLATFYDIEFTKYKASVVHQVSSNKTINSIPNITDFRTPQHPKIFPYFLSFTLS